MSDELELQSFDSQLTQYMALEEQRKTGHGILVPSPGEEMKGRIPLISGVSGRPPDLYLTIAAGYEMELGDAMIEHRAPKDSQILTNSLIMDILKLTCSRNYFRAKQIEEISKVSPRPEPPRRLFGLLPGKR